MAKPKFKYTWSNLGSIKVAKHGFVTVSGRTTWFCKVLQKNWNAKHVEYSMKSYCLHYILHTEPGHGILKEAQLIAKGLTVERPALSRRE